MDIVCIQPMFQREGRQVLADLYGGFMERDDFVEMMDEVVQDVNLEGSTPSEPKKYVRTLVINDFENTRNPQIKFRWSDAQNPDDIEPGWHLCDEEYWKVEKNRLGNGRRQRETIDIVDELDQVLL